MPFMPFQIIGMWLRSLFALALLAGGLSLIAAWYKDASVPERPVQPPPEEPRLPEQAPEPGTEPRRELDQPRPGGVSLDRWRPGLDRATAFLVGGVLLLAWSLGGWFLLPLFRTAAPADEPQPPPPTAVHTVPRPDGTHLHVEVHGPADAPTLVLTHGWTLDSQEWCYTRKQLAGNFRLITWDLPGLGRSTRPSNNDWSLEKLAGDLEAVVSLAGDKPVVLVGHSIGGMITLTYCKLFPQNLGTRVGGLVIAHSTYTNPVKTAAHSALYSALQKPVLEPLCHLMIWLAPLVWLMNQLSYLNGSAHRSTEKSSFSGRESRGQLNFLTRLWVKSWPGVVARGLLAMFRYDATATLATIPVPALIVAGDQDTLCTPEASVFMSRTIPNAQLSTLHPAKHGGLFEHHGRFNNLVAEFASACRCAEMGRTIV